MSEKILNSVVIPIFNEQEIIDELYKRLTDAMQKLSKDYEIIFVDDGSTDKSFEILKDLHLRDNRVKIVTFSRNFGHHIAITAGLDYANGDAVILMDGDLQDAPEEIPKLYKKYKEGYDNVYAVRKTRKDNFFKKFFSKNFYRFFKVICKFEIPTDTGVFRIISRRVVNAIKNCREQSRFLLALIHWLGFPSVGVEIERQGRYAGKAKYNFFKSAKLGIDAIISFSQAPLQVATYSGLFIATISFVMGFFMLIKRIFFGMPVSGYASIIVSVFFLGGIQLIIIGIVGEYLGRVHNEVKQRPLYIIQELLK